MITPSTSSKFRVLLSLSASSLKFDLRRPTGNVQSKMGQGFRFFNLDKHRSLFPGNIRLYLQTRKCKLYVPLLSNNLLVPKESADGRKIWTLLLGQR
ncbi:hypothetical protein ABKN59_011683 [Abortiporus biennis]